MCVSHRPHLEQRESRIHMRFDLRSIRSFRQPEQAPPMRLFCPPEISVVTLTAPERRAP